MTGFAAPPGTSKPSIVDRILGRLFPTEQYAGLLDPGQQQGLQHQGLLGLGMGVLSQTGAGSGPFVSLGKAYQGLDFHGMADHALALQNLRNQQQEQQALASVAARHPPQPGETRMDAYTRFADIAAEMATIPGGAAIAEKMAPLVAAMKPDRSGEPQHISGIVDTRLGSPTIGQSGTFIIPYAGAPREAWTFLKGAPKEATPKEPTPQERVAGSQFEGASASIRAMEDIAARNPDAVQQAVAALKASRWGKLGTLYTEARGTLNSQDAQDFYTHYSNMLLSVTPTYGGTRPTVPLMDLEKAATLPAIGAGDFKAAFDHMHNRLNDLQAKAGKAMHAQPIHPSGTFDEFLK